MTSLTKLQTKTAILGLTALLNCGPKDEIHNNYYINNGSSPATCDDWASKLLQCNITDSGATYESVVKECKKARMEEYASVWLNCIKDTPCSDLQQGACAEYMPTH
ncbi:MAG: hypothetical protein Q8R47_00215 [Nanoarchaeota archaeon]|nr:hypothetical protein [Nanoarchaeota archaeon]